MYNEIKYVILVIKKKCFTSENVQCSVFFYRYMKQLPLGTLLLNPVDRMICET